MNLMQRLLLPLSLVPFVCAGSLASAQTSVYVAPDDHTDFVWSATEAEYERYFGEMLDYHVARADEDIAHRIEDRLQNRFTADGTYWLWVYAKQRSAARFKHVMDRIKSGHLTVNMTPLDILQGTLPAEAALRQLYYAGTLERQFGVQFPMAWVAENATMPLGVASLWAGAGARYSWNGICNCATTAPGLRNRQDQIYRWAGLDGSSVLMKWYEIPGENTSIGGYAEARELATSLSVIRSKTFTGRYGPRSGSGYSVFGIFGSGWDDRETLTTNTRDQVRSMDTSSTRYTVSNMVDFFTEFEKVYGASLPRQSVSYGIEWDRAPASLAEVSASVKRSVEKLRTAEALATIASLENPNFMASRAAARDKMQLDLGLYFEHDFTNGGPGASAAARIAFQRRIAREITSYVDALASDSLAAVGSLIKKRGGKSHIFVFNPLSYSRTDVVDYPYAGRLPVRVLSAETQAEIPSQMVGSGAHRRIRLEAHDVPAYGYRVYELDNAEPAPIRDPVSVDASTGSLASRYFKLQVNGTGAITSLQEGLHQGRELVRKPGLLNSLAGGSGTLTVEDAGPLTATLVAKSTAGLDHTTRVTLYRGVPRVSIVNEITKNFGDERGYRYDFALNGVDTWHEEVGAVIRARLANDGGHYAMRNAKYDYQTLNHFVSMTGSDGFGITFSNADAYIMRLGNSTVDTLDTKTASLTAIAGGVYDCIQSQGGDTYFVNHFALGTHSSFDPAASMRFALEHQNPLVAGEVTGTIGTYPDSVYSLMTISNPQVLGWALKPAQDGGSGNVVVRLWNLSSSKSDVELVFARSVTAGTKLTHIETPLKGAVAIGSNSITASLNAQQIVTYGATLGGVSATTNTARSVDTRAGSGGEPLGGGREPSASGASGAPRGPHRDQVSALGTGGSTHPGVRRGCRCQSAPNPKSHGLLLTLGLALFAAATRKYTVPRKSTLQQ